MIFLADLLPYLVEPGIPNSPNESATIALYGMIAMLGVAAITGGFQMVNKILGNKVESSSPTATIKRTAKQAEAWEKWMLLNGIDPRKVKTGYESMEEVRRAPAP